MFDDLLRDRLSAKRKDRQLGGPYVFCPLEEMKRPPFGGASSV